MADSTPKIGILDHPVISRELDLVSKLFHRINRIIPQDQKMLTILPNRPVREAVELMLEHGYSQIPVIENGQVLGVFSFRSFSKEAAKTTLNDWNRQRCAPGDLPVDEFLEQLEFARMTEDINRVRAAMDKDDGILIGTPDRLIGIITPVDFLKYLYQVASPFVMVSEIELALRALISTALKPEQIAVAAKHCLPGAYDGEDKVPTSLEDMTFRDYHTLISHSKNWSQFESVFGGTRNRTSGKLKEIGELRNDLFHFKREITMQDHHMLADHRNWLLSKIKQADARRGKETK